MASIETSRMRLASSGKIPTTSERRGVSRGESSRAVEARERIRGAQLGPVLSRERVEGEHVGLGLLEHGGHLRQPPLELLDGVAQALARLLAILGGEDRPNDRAEGVVLLATDMAPEIAQKVHRAALPRRAEHLRERRLQTRMGV